MPPRIPLLSRLGTSALCLRLASKPPVLTGLPISSIANASSKAQRRKRHDPYALAQARQRKMANVNRQEELRKEREVAFGDPVRGITTPFVESFDTAGAIKVSTIEGEDGLNTVNKVSETIKPAPLNHFVNNAELEQSLQHSFLLTQPIASTNRTLLDPSKEAEDIKSHVEAHERATSAIRRILDLSNGNQKDRTRFNIQRCIDTFGRHNTDDILRPKAASASGEVAEKPPRAGPDTGSSEVQIAILTAKIRVLANHLEGHRGHKDKINKRNLRVLVHRRQKLLAYLQRQERGSERWQNVVETLGLTEGTWKGEISL